MSKTKIALCVALVAAGCRAFDDAARDQHHSDPYEPDTAMQVDAEPYVTPATQDAKAQPASAPVDKHGKPVPATVPGNPTEGNSTLGTKSSAPSDAEVPGNPVEGNSTLGTKSTAPSGTTSTATKTAGTAAAGTAAKTAAVSSPLSEAEKRFVQQAYSAGMFEIESSQWAMSRLTEAEHRETARQMIADHTKANEELAAIALRHGMQVERTLLPEHARMLEELRSAPADDQDEAFEKAQLRAHQAAIALFENAARTCESADLKAFAEKTLPTLRKHVEHFDDDADDKDDDEDDMDDDRDDEDMPPDEG